MIEISDDKDDDLAKAIELSLREAHVSTINMLVQYIINVFSLYIFKEFSIDYFEGLYH